MSTVFQNNLAKPPTIYSDQFYANLRIGKIGVDKEQVITDVKRITGLDPPIEPTDAASKQYVDTASGGSPGLPLTSVQYNDAGVFTGSSDFVWNDFTKFLVVNGYITLPNAPVNPTDAANKAYVDAATGSAPGLPFTSVQYNDGGIFAGTNDFVWDNTNKILTVNGDVVANTYNTTSDATLKTNVEQIDNPLNYLNKIEGYSYNLLGNKERTYGVMAQEVEQIDGLENIVKKVGDRKIVDYQQFVPLLIESVKELSQEVNELKKDRVIRKKRRSVKLTQV